MNILELIKQKVTGTGIPDARFKPNTELYQLCVRLAGSGDVQPAGETDEDAIARWLGELAGKISNVGGVVELGDIDCHIPEIDVLGDRIAERVRESADALTQLGETVTRLTEEIESTYSADVAVDPRLVRYIDGEAETTFDDYPFAAIRTAGGFSNLMQVVAADTGMRDIEAHRASLIRIADMYEVKVLNIGTLSNIPVTKEQTSALVEAANMANTDMLDDKIRTVLKYMVSDTALDALADRTVRTIRNSVTKPFTSVAELIKIVADFRDISAELYVQAEKLGMDAEFLTELEKRVDIITAITNVAAFAVHVHRKDTFKDVLIFQNRLLNPDLKTEMENAQVSMLDIAQHLTTYYSDREIPASGIVLNTVVSALERVRAGSAKYRANEKAYATTYMVRIRREAFKSVVTAFLTDPANIQQFKLGGEIRDWVNVAANEIIVKDIACEESLYSLLISCLYPGTFIATLHQRLGVRYMKAAATNKDIGPADISKVNLGVYAELITEMITNTFITRAEEVSFECYGEDLDASTEGFLDRMVHGLSKVFSTIEGTVDRMKVVEQELPELVKNADPAKFAEQTMICYDAADLRKMIKVIDTYIPIMLETTAQLRSPDESHADDLLKVAAALTRELDLDMIEIKSTSEYTYTSTEYEIRSTKLTPKSKEATAKEHGYTLKDVIPMVDSIMQHGSRYKEVKQLITKQPSMSKLRKMTPAAKLMTRLYYECATWLMRRVYDATRDMLTVHKAVKKSQ